jgi:phage gpG-like protein
MANVTRQSAGVTFDLRTDPPLKEFEFKLSRFSKGISDFSPMFERIGGVFRQQMKKQFQSEGALGSGRWAKLSDGKDGVPGYATWKARHFPGAKIGHLTGALEKSMTGGSGYSQDIRPREASFGMDTSSKAVSYGKYFAGGTDKMPARPVIVATALRGTQLRRTVDIWVRDEAHHAGLIGAGSQIYNTPLSGLAFNESLPVS